MTTASDRFSEVCSLAESLGYRVRQRWLDGCGGSEIRTKSQRWIFVDDMQRPEEQVDSVLRILREDARANLNGRRAA